MSEAYKQQWSRTSASRRLLNCLCAIAKRTPGEPIRLDVAELESVGNTEGITESFEGGVLVLRYVPDSSAVPRTYLIENQSTAVERSQAWPLKDENSNETPTRLRELLTMPVEHQQARTTLDDSALAELEKRQARTKELQQRAAARRGVPLPVTQPTHPPGN